MNNKWKQLEGWKLPIVSAVALVLALGSVFSNPSQKARKPLVVPSSSPYSSSVAGIGVVEPKSEIISIGVELPGVVRSMHVHVGDVVEKGDPLFSLDEREVDAEIKTLEASLVSSAIQAQDTAAQFAIVENMKDKRAVSQDDYNRRKFAEERARANVRELEAKLEQARTTKERLTVKAPINGTVLEINIRPGEFASAGMIETPLMRMGDTSTLHLRVEVDEENAASVSKAAKAKAFPRGDSKHGYDLTFVRFEPFVQPKKNLAVMGQRVDTRVLQVIYAITPTDMPILIGQQMDVFIARIPMDTKPKPASAQKSAPEKKEP